MNNVKSHIAIMSLLQSFKKHQNMRIARQRNHFVRNSSLFLFATVSNCSVLFLSILIACLIGLCKKTITWEMLAEIRKYSFIFRYQSQPGRGQLLLFHCVNEKKLNFAYWYSMRKFSTGAGQNPTKTTHPPLQPEKLTSRFLGGLITGNQTKTATSLLFLPPPPPPSFITRKITTVGSFPT